MPKLKTNRGAQKRFRKTGSGSFKRRRANRNHILTKKAPKRKRQLRGPAQAGHSEEVVIKRMLPNA